MLKAISIVPICASFLGAFAYQTDSAQPGAATAAVQQVAAQAALASEPLLIAIDDGTQWSDVFEVLETEVASSSAREALGALIGELEDLAYAGEEGVDEFNTVLELTIDEFWNLTEVDGSLSYGERDLVFDVLMSAIANFDMAEGTTRWVETETLEGQKCKTPATATCQAAKPKQTCIKKKEQKKQKDGTYVDSGKVKCESGTIP